MSILVWPTKAPMRFLIIPIKHEIMALAYTNYDILSVFDKNGDIKFNVLGEMEFESEDPNFKFFNQVRITDEYIIASYLGDSGIKLDDNKRPKGVQPGKLLFFNLAGKLEKVIDTGHQIMTFAVDEDNSRVFCYFTDREVPIGYINYE